jgi:hypothetical protein
MVKVINEIPSGIINFRSDFDNPATGAITSLYKKPLYFIARSGIRSINTNVQRRMRLSWSPLELSIHKTPQKAMRHKKIGNQIMNGFHHP